VCALPLIIQTLEDGYNRSSPFYSESVIAGADFKSVDDYIAAQPEAVRGVLEHVRGAIRRAAPGALEGISYNMPTYTLNGNRLLHFAAWKQHCSIYAATAGVVAAFKGELASYQVDKGTIRFPLSEPVPVELIGRITKFRANEVEDRGKAKGWSRRELRIYRGVS
jgi:uncharacterized protein YdhG (YjbR/CyaY superfamily)